MSQRQDDLSTADLAAQQPTDTAPPDRMEPADPERPDLAADGSSRGGPVVEDGGSQDVGAADATSSSAPLLASQDAESFRARWTDVQTGFVDEPRRAVEQADGLVAEVMRHLARTFADERAQLERQWDRGDDIPTDDLRAAFQRYRSFFERLLAT